MLRPRVRRCGTVVVDVYRVSADVSVVAVAVVSITVVVIGVVIGVVVGIVVPIAVVVAAVVIPAVPGSVSVVRAPVIHHCRSMPPTVPAAISPAAASTAHHRSNGDSNPESNDGGRSHIAGCISG